MEAFKTKHMRGEPLQPAGAAEGSLPHFPDWAAPTISYAKLQEVLVNTSLCIDPRVRVTTSWVSRANGTLIDEVLGKKESYTVAEELQKLRNIPNASKTSEQRLLQRVLSFISYDGLNPVSVHRQNPLQIFEDLNLEDAAIQPLPHPISVVSDQAKHLKLEKDNPNVVTSASDLSKLTKPDFFCIDLYKDPKRRIRLHVYHPFASQADIPTLEHDDRPHDHDGKSGSILLAGKLVNQHMEPIKVSSGSGKAPADADYGVYSMHRMLPKESKEFDKRGTWQYFAKFKLKTSNVYTAGQQYFLPASATQEHLNPKSLKGSEMLGTHRIATFPQTVTLFTQEYAPSRDFLTTFPSNFPKTLYQRRAGDDTDNSMAFDDVHSLMKNVAKWVRSSLKNIDRPSTIIERAHERRDVGMTNLIAERLKNPLIPEVGRRA